MVPSVEREALIALLRTTVASNDGRSVRYKGCKRGGKVRGGTVDPIRLAVGLAEMLATTPRIQPRTCCE